MISPGEINEEGIKISNSLLKSTRSALARLCPRFIRDFYHSWSWQIRKVRKYSELMGWTPQLELYYHRNKPTSTNSYRKLQFTHFPYPLWYRPGSSDPEVIFMVFGDKEYQCVSQETDIEFIVDCGANVGYTTLFLLNCYPKARAIVVEPSSSNMELCKKNLSVFGDRITYINTGVWSKSVPLIVEQGKYRDGKEWSIQVREAKSGEQEDLQALTIDDILLKAGFPRIDILKVDIERAEAVVFAGPTPWLDKTRTLVIELHDSVCEDVVSRAVQEDFSNDGKYGDLTLYKRKGPLKA